MREHRGNSLKQSAYLARLVYFAEIVKVKFQYLAFDHINRPQVFRVKILVHGLRHTAHKHIQPQIAHILPVEVITHRAISLQ